MGSLIRSAKPGAGLLAVFCALCCHCVAQPTDYRIREDSAIEIHLKSGGLFGFLGDEHLILAPIERGRIRHDPESAEGSSVQLDVRTNRIQVQDPGLKEEDRAEVQRKMESESVLQVDAFPWMNFESSAIRALSEQEFLVRGNLTLRDVTAPVTVRVKVESLRPVFRATGSARFKQTRFGIKPIKAGAGTVRVKDEIELTFTVNAVPVDPE